MSYPFFPLNIIANKTPNNGIIITNSIVRKSPNDIDFLNDSSTSLSFIDCCMLITYPTTIIIITTKNISSIQLFESIFYHLLSHCFIKPNYLKKKEIVLCNYQLDGTSNSHIFQSRFSKEIVGCADGLIYCQTIHTPTNSADKAKNFFPGEIRIARIKKPIRTAKPIVKNLCSQIFNPETTMPETFSDVNQFIKVSRDIENTREPKTNASVPVMAIVSNVFIFISLRHLLLLMKKTSLKHNLLNNSENQKIERWDTLYQLPERGDNFFHLSIPLSFAIKYKKSLSSRCNLKNHHLFLEYTCLSHLSFTLFKFLNVLFVGYNNVFGANNLFPYLVFNNYNSFNIWEYSL